MENKEVKLYTEEQVREAIKMTRNEYPFRYVQDIINDLTPIELPSDEEINDYANDNVESISFVNGAKWMRDKTYGGNK